MADLAFAPRPGGRWSVEAEGWSLHAGVCIQAGEFESRERLVRYVARPSLALGRLSELPDGRLAYRVRWARPGSGPYRIMDPLGPVGGPDAARLDRNSTRAGAARATYRELAARSGANL